MARKIVAVKGVRFDLLGPVDQRRTVEFSPGGMALCPACAGASRRVGTFLLPNPESRPSARRYFFAHLESDHYRCRECGWVGTVPGAHVARSKNHRGPVSNVPRPRPKPMRISDLHG